MTNPNHTDTSRSGDLVERLRGDKYTCRENMGCGTMEFCACATMEDAADRIKQLEAALRIIVRETTAVSPDVLNQQMCIDAVNRHAIAALGDGL